MPTASAKPLIVDLGFFNKVCKILSRVDFIQASITGLYGLVNILDKYHKYYIGGNYRTWKLKTVDQALQFPAESIARTLQK